VCSHHHYLETRSQSGFLILYLKKVAEKVADFKNSLR